MRKKISKIAKKRILFSPNPDEMRKPFSNHRVNIEENSIGAIVKFSPKMITPSKTDTKQYKRGSLSPHMNIMEECKRDYHDEKSRINGSNYENNIEK